MTAFPLRHDLSAAPVDLMKYEIREIVDFVEQLQKLDPSLQLEMENIGDPIKKGWPVPGFLKDLLKDEIDREGDRVFAYTHSRGRAETRQWIADYSRRFCPQSQLTADDVLITSGLGAGIAALYHMLPKGQRILQPSPSYPTHASMESFAAEAPSLSYQLDPKRDWQPDLEDLEDKLKAHPEIAGILIINPNNPTGALYSAETLEGMVALAERYGCMIVSDEIYFRMTYQNRKFAHITQIAHQRVPLVVMRGLSKDVPWPGGRCGWLEFHNTQLDERFAAFCQGVKKRILMEVCSVTLTQTVLPAIYDHPEFEAWLSEYKAGLQEAADDVAKILSSVPELMVNPVHGAFYMMPVFREGTLNHSGTLPIANDAVRAFVEEKVAQAGVAPDKRFAYYLLASTGICVVPASGFFSPYYGFRVTTLTRDPQRRREIYHTLANAIKAYLASQHGPTQGVKNPGTQALHSPQKQV